MAVLEALTVDLKVVLGRARMPLHMFLRMGRGAVIALEATETDTVEILANGHAVARGQIVVTGNRVAIEVTQTIRRAGVRREVGAAIGAGALPPPAADAA